MGLNWIGIKTFNNRHCHNFCLLSAIIYFICTKQLQKNSDIDLHLIWILMLVLSKFSVLRCCFAHHRWNERLLSAILKQSGHSFSFQLFHQQNVFNLSMYRSHDISFISSHHNHRKSAISELQPAHLALTTMPRSKSLRSHFFLFWLAV